MKFRPTCTPLEDRTTPAVLQVNSLLDNTTAGDGLVTLREAVIAANTDATTDLGDKGIGADTIIFVGSAVGGTITLTQEAIALQTGMPQIASNITIQGEQGKNITLTNGQTVGGSRIFAVNAGATLNLSYVTFVRTSGNQQNQYSATTSAASVAAGGILNVSDSIFEMTSAATGLNGGAIANSGTLSVDRSLFTQSFGKLGGAVFNDGQATIQRSSFTGNSASGVATSIGAGGAIYNTGSMIVSNTTLTGNSAPVGGGIYTNGNLTLVNDSIIANYNPLVLVSGGTFISPGAGVYSEHKAGVDPVIRLQNTLLAGNYFTTPSSSVFSNTYSTGAGIDPTSNHNLVVEVNSSPGIVNGVNGNIVGVPAQYSALADNGGPTQTFALAAGSPALGVGTSKLFGTNAIISLFDQRGTPHDMDAPDIGAYEAEHPLGTSSGPTDYAHLFAPKPSASPNEAFIKGLYQATLNRTPEAAGLSGWLAAMTNGASRETVANGFVNSVENRTKQVTKFYNYFLNRSPDQAGLTFYVDSLRGGTDEGVVLNKFVLSPEFLFQNDNSSFVNKLYYGLLGRQADQPGFDGWMTTLANGTTREAVANAFLRSTESINRVAGSYFATYLQREADVGGLISFNWFLNTHTFGEAAISFLGSQAFYNNAFANQ